MNMNNIVQLIYNLNGEIGIHWTHEDKVRFAEKIICNVLRLHIMRMMQRISLIRFSTTLEYNDETNNRTNTCTIVFPGEMALAEQ